MYDMVCLHFYLEPDHDGSLITRYIFLSEQLWHGRWLSGESALIKKHLTFNTTVDGNMHFLKKWIKDNLSALVASWLVMLRTVFATTFPSDDWMDRPLPIFPDYSTASHTESHSESTRQISHCKSRLDVNKSTPVYIPVPDHDKNK